jgi:hypothetical protein
MFTGFKLHTTETIGTGRDELMTFSELIKVRNTTLLLYTSSLLADQNM